MPRSLCSSADAGAGRAHTRAPPRQVGGAVTHAPRDPTQGLRRPAEAGSGCCRKHPAGDLVLAGPGMAGDVGLARRSRWPWPWRWLSALLLLQLLRWRCALGALPFTSSRHPGFVDLLSERQLLEVQDLTLTLLQGGGLGPLSLLPRDLPDLEPECRELLMDFANSSAELTACMVRSARPVRLCQTCYPLFQQVAVKMDNISRNVGVGRGAASAPVAWGLGK